MALPKDITFVTFDVYGTLIDWEEGAFQAFKKEAARDGVTLTKEEVVPLFLSHQREIMSGSYELYAEVLRRTAIAVAADLGWALEPSRAGFLPASVVRWRPFKDTGPALKKITAKKSTGLISNIDDKLLGETRRHLGIDLELVVTAQQVRSYKPDAAHFKECERRMGSKKGWVHVGSSYFHDVEPCLQQKVPVIWLNRDGAEQLETGQKRPTAEAATLKDVQQLLGL